MSIEFATRYLADMGLTRETLIAAVRGPEETTLLLTGSIAAGTANPSSDIDLCALGPAELDADIVLDGPSNRESIAVLPGERKLCLEQWPADRLAALEGKIALLQAVLEDPASGHSVPLLGEQEVALLHELRGALVLRNEAGAQRWRKRLRPDLLPHYLLLFATTQYLTCKEDSVAQQRLGNMREAVWIARHGLDKLAIAVLATCGMTNPRFKWRLRQLDECRAAYEDGLVDMLIERMQSYPRSGDEEAWVAQAFGLSDRLLGEALFRIPGLLQPLLRLGRKLPFDLGMASAA